jgi:hypothetical protein
MMRTFSFVVLAFTLAACGQSTAPPAEPATEAEAQSTPFVGIYTALSTTAMSITGDMDASPDELVFSTFRIEGARIEATLAGDTDLSAGGGTINSGSGLDIAELELRRIETIRSASATPAPDLCGGAPPSFLILGFNRDRDVLTLQIFSGAEAPGPNAHNTQLCGIYNYAPFVA